jgi:hypothetical protein
MTLLAAMTGSLALLASSFMTPTPVPQAAAAGTTLSESAPVVEITDYSGGDYYHDNRRRRHNGNGIYFGNGGAGLYLDFNTDNRRHYRRNYSGGRCNGLRYQAERSGTRYSRNRYYNCLNG